MEMEGGSVRWRRRGKQEGNEEDKEVVVKLQCHTQSQFQPSLLLSSFHNNYLKKKDALFTVMLDTLKKVS
jgi:hypothetical protein